MRKGDAIKLVDIPLELFLGLSESEQKTLRAEIGKLHLIQSVNQHGKLKLEFSMQEVVPILYLYAQHV